MISTPLDHEPIPAAQETVKYCAGWKAAMQGNISYISESADGSRILVSTSSDKGIPKGFEGRLRLLNSSGKVLWSKWLKQPAKSQTISSDGSLIAFSNYEDKLYVLNAQGKVLWEKSHLGTPLIFAKHKRIVLFNDDDSDAQMAFTTYDFAGRKIGDVNVPKYSEAIDMHSSTDENIIAIAMRGGRFNAYDVNGKILTEEKIDGEPSAIATNGTAIFTLYSDKTDKNIQIINSYDLLSKKTLWSKKLDRRYEVLRILGNTLMLYGNSVRGQAVSGIDISNGNEKWKRAFPGPANYSSPVIANTSFLSVLIDKSGSDTSVQAGTIHLVGLNTEGQAVFEIPVSAADGIYSYAINAIKPTAVVGAGEPGDGVLHTFTPSEDNKCKEYQ